ncbi:chorion class B protein ERB4-like [Bicyclus anynana]|uniref:Chorion class B protein ERB4-like n=1 Tax=Bicyclus anynana TaxID=110368 RepID=A0ABM3LV70_BICAN|nr:chorion class B protein ERB4-like [Bicyclus anynana]
MANALPMTNCAYLDNGLAAEFVTDLSNGGRFTVISSSRVPSSGLKVHSDNLAVDGPLAVTGQMPFLGIVSLNGAVPADGIGTVLYECGNGRVGITEEVEENAFRNLGFGVSCNGLGYATPTYGYIVL